MIEQSCLCLGEGDAGNFLTNLPVAAAVVEVFTVASVVAVVPVVDAC